MFWTLLWLMYISLIACAVLSLVLLAVLVGIIIKEEMKKGKRDDN